jgi:hypothetical protein
MHTRFAKFVNLPELLSMFRSFADVQTADMLHLPRPATKGGKPQITASPSSPDLKAYVETLVDRAQKLRTMKIDPAVDNMLKITGDGRKAALDMRLVDPFARPGDTKVSRAVDNIYAAWAVGKERRSTQLVFCDLSTPNPDRFNVYDEMREKLIARGIPFTVSGNGYAAFDTIKIYFGNPRTLLDIRLLWHRISVVFRSSTVRKDHSHIWRDRLKGHDLGNGFDRSHERNIQWRSGPFQSRFRNRNHDHRSH